MSDFQVIELNSNFDKHFKKVQVKPVEERWKDFPPCVLLKQWSDRLEFIKKFEVYEDDIFLTGFPRSGTTIVAEMIWLIANNFDFAKALTVETDDRFPGLEYDDQIFTSLVLRFKKIFLRRYDKDSQMIRKGKFVNTFETLPRPRTIKTHMPVQFLPDDIWIKKPKMIYCSRDPRDVAISLYHFNKHYASQSLNDFLDYFMSDKLFWGPYREHRLNYWNIPNYENILYLTYEDITTGIDSAIRSVAKFLNVDISDENFAKLKEHLRFDKMKSKINKVTNNNELS